MTHSSAVAALVLSAGLLPSACSRPHSGSAAGPAEPTTQTPTVQNMPSSNDTTAARPMPPIDAAAPAAYQTATFALG